jgi:hypothetical protein
MADAAVSCDVDTLASIYKGYDCRRSGGYTYVEFRMGIESFMRFLEPFGIKATLFMVGKDLLQEQNVPHARAAVAEGHEIANHTLSHVQGFRFLSPEEKEAEIAAMEEVCEEVTGKRPVGFRSPGWNISDDALPILKRRGYLYDSSVFPSSLNPLLKILQWFTVRKMSRKDRSTLGQLGYALAPTCPYRTSENSLGRRGDADFVEFPLTVVPLLRLPFFATFLLATGLQVFKTCFRILKAFKRPIFYQFHLSDFVDYDHPDLLDQVPRARGVYVPKALRISLSKKMSVLQPAMEMIASDSAFLRLDGWAHGMLENRT